MYRVIKGHMKRLKKPPGMFTFSLLGLCKYVFIRTAWGKHFDTNNNEYLLTIHYY